MSADQFAEFKKIQKENWAFFAPLEVLTTQPAGLLVDFAGVKAGQKVLDAACGTGVVAITAAKVGAVVRGLDLSPVLLEKARQNAAISGLEAEFFEGDVESLPFKDAEFDCVLSQFGHMFAPRPQAAISEMLRVLKPGGVIAFSTWPPELYTARMFALVGKYLPPPEGVPPSTLWGDPAVIKERLGGRTTDLFFDMAMMHTPALTIEHLMANFEKTSGHIIRLKETLEKDNPAALDAFRHELRSLLKGYIKLNTLHQQFLMTRARKI